VAVAGNPPAVVHRLSAAQRARLSGCLLVVVCAHAVVLAMPPGASTIAAAGPTRAALHVRLVPTQPAAVPATAAPTGAEPAAAPSVTRPPPSNASQTLAGAEPARVEVRAPMQAAPAADFAPLPAASLERDADYLPRSALTVAPRAQAPVTVANPFFDGEADHYVGEFDLFIDDTGGVVRVVVATPDLPGILSNAVRDAFLPARFVPGEVDGRPVRSRIRIEVTFDSVRPTES
jgi:protein TonB